MEKAIEPQLGTRNKGKLGVGELIAHGLLQSFDEKLEQLLFAEIDHRVGMFAFRIQNPSHYFQSRQHFSGVRIRNPRAEDQMENMCGLFVALPPGAANTEANQVGSIKVNALDAAKIDQANVAVGLKQIIARMMVRVQRPEPMELNIVKLDQSRSDQIPHSLGGLLVQKRPHDLTFHKGHCQNPFAGQVPLNLWKG